MTVNIDVDGVILINGQEYTIAQFESEIMRVISSLGDDPNRLQLLVRADGRIDTGIVNELFEVLNRHQVKQVRVSARSSK